MTRDNDKPVREVSPQDALRALVDHWRTVAGKVVDSGYATATRLCADDLERALLSGGGDSMRGHCIEADFSEDTMTFRMSPGYVVRSGEYVITPAVPTTPEASK